ncbi:uncharacterized protein LOC143912046 [Arctopsyche grandis]|uniref:uncharacterized protein LOC143912046 n=1 Tax=Arctopsyche grandis TaxID=121162 RepID=UPI00406DA17F
MDDGVIIVLDYDNICRLCLQTRGALSDIFSGDLDDDTPSLHNQIADITDVPISITDNLPKKICHKCRYIVELCYELRTTVIKSNKLLCDSIETNDLIDEVAQAIKMTSGNVDFCSNENLTDLIANQSEEADETLLEDEIKSTKKSKRKDIKLNYFKDIDFHDDIKKELCPESGDMVIECKMEMSEDFDAKLEAERKEYVSSKDVVLDEIRIDDNESSEVNLLPELSDDGGSDGLMIRQKDIGLNDRPTKQQTCQLCLEVFSDRSSLISHVAEHYNDTNLVSYLSISKPFICQDCNINFTTKMDLIIHHREHLEINPYMCKIIGCNFDIRTKEALRHHMYTHAVKKFVCNQCGARYRRKVEMMRHKVRHLDEGRQFRCGLCFVICKNRLSLKAHLKNHENGRRFKCDFPGCPKAFFSNSDLTIHLRSHSNDKCFKCPSCICAYISRSQLNRHLRRHEKPGPTKCDKCSEIFDDYGSFCNHRIATHGEWQPHRCKGCNQGYQSEQQLQKHLTRCKVAMKMRTMSTDAMDISMEDVETSDLTYLINT